MRAPWKRAIAAAATIVLATAFCAAHAAAQKNQGPPNPLQGFSQNRDQPVKIQAASFEVREKDKIATFSGDVQVFQGDTEMRCKSLTVHYDEDSGAKGLKAADPGPAGQQQIRRIEAKGGVTVIQKDQNAQGDTGIFDMRANTVTLVGNVIVTRGQDVLRGRKLTVDLTSGTSKIDGAEALFGRGGAMGPEKMMSPEKK